MAKLFQHFAEQHEKAVGGILGARPARGVEQLVGGGGQIDEVLQVPASVAIHGRVQFQEDLIPPADITDGEAGAVDS